MSVSLTRRLFPWLLGVALLAVGCHMPPSKVEYNSRLAEANQILAKEALAFHRALIPAGGRECDPATVDLPKLKQAYDGMVTALAKVQAKFGALELPRHSKTAEALKAAYEDYLVEQQKILDKCNEIVTILGDPKLTKEEQKAKVNKLLLVIFEIEQVAYGKLGEAQTAFATAHNFKLVEKLD